jgi:carboxymethylenebutenolidase
MATVSAAQLITTDVNIPGEGATLRGFLARPDAGRPKPAVLIIHEWWGLNDHIKEIARRFASEGYAALAVDLYSRMGSPVTKDAAEAAKLMERLQSQLALKDLNASTRYLKSQPFADPSKIAVVGFCMGGTFALTLATHNSDIKASVPFYGQVPPLDSFKYLLCPVLYIYGGQDTWITKQDVARLQQGFKDYRKPGEVAIYQDCPHAFFNDTRPDVYRPQQAADAWQRTLRFLERQLCV